MRRHLVSASRFVAFCSAALLVSAAVAQTPIPKPPPPPEPVAVSPQQPPAPPTAPELKGEMRVEYLGLMDQRVDFAPPPPERAPRPALRILFKLTGEKLGDLYRCGKVVIEELVDDTGAKLFDPATIAEKDKTATAIVNTAGALQAGYHMLDLNATPAARAAKSITSAKGHVNIMFGGPTEDITIENPMQFVGKTIEHPRLASLGLKVRVLKLGGEEATEPADGRGIALAFEPSDEQIKALEFYDENFKKVAARPRDSRSEKVDGYKFYGLAGGLLTADTQMVLTVFTKIEKKKVEFHLKNLTLP